MKSNDLIIRTLALSVALVMLYAITINWDLQTIVQNKLSIGNKGDEHGALVSESKVQVEPLIRNKTSTSQSISIKYCSPEQRAHLIRKQCRTRGKLKEPSITPQRKWKFHYIWTIDEHKLLLCLPLKTGSTTFLSLLVKYSSMYNASAVNMKKLAIHQDKVLQQFGIKRLKYYDNLQIMERLSDFKKIMLVRNPMIRVYSAFRQKIRGPAPCTGYQPLFGSRIIRSLRKNYTEEEAKCGRGVTFPEFLTYFIKNKKEMLNEGHWKPIMDACLPCDVTYDQVLRLETGHTDGLTFINQNLAPPNKPVKDIYKKNSGGSPNETDTYAKQFTQIEPAYAEIEPDVFENIKAEYAEDLAMFGYTAQAQEGGMKAACSMATDTGERCC